MSTQRSNVIDEWRAGMDEGLVPQGIFNDEELYELEMERIFAREWQFVGFTDEISDPGDYVVRPIGNKEYIVTRDEDGDVRILLNRCRHQGTPVCNVEAGNTSHFRCRYHGWTYDNEGDLIGVPHKDSAYGDDLDPDEMALEPIANYDTYEGMIFANPDPDAEPLEEFLGDFRWYMDFFTGTTDEGLYVTGPTRSIANLNWKMSLLNVVGDTYHGPTTHRSGFETGLIGPDTEQFGDLSEYKLHIACGPGALELARRPYIAGHRDEVKDTIRRNVSDDQWAVMADQGWTPNNCGLFPNVVMVNLSMKVAEDEKVPITMVQTFVPRGPSKTEVFSWVVNQKEAGKEHHEKAVQAATFTFGSGGTFLQDDIDIWSRVTESGEGPGPGGDDRDMKLTMKLDEEHVEEDPDFPGPGRVYGVEFSEENGRYYLDMVLDALGNGDAGADGAGTEADAGAEGDADTEAE